MKKNSFLKNLIFITAGVAAVLLIYVFVLAEIKTLSKEKVRTQDLLSEKKNKIEAAQVEIQKLTAEERIVRIATDSLGMVRSAQPFETINVNKSQIEQIEKIVNSKYE